MIADKAKEKEHGEEEIKIEVTKNGPYIVSGKVPVFEQIIIVDKEGIPVEWRKGKEYPAREKCGLCRCGQTANKPYCDGSHIKAGFDGTETAGFEPFAQKAKIIDGPELKLADNEDLCASARFCHREGEIWNLIPKTSEPRAKQVAIASSRTLAPPDHILNCPIKESMMARLSMRVFATAAAVPAAAFAVAATAAEPAVCVESATIADLHEALAAGRTTAADLVLAYTARIAAYDRAGPRLNAVREMNPDAPPSRTRRRPKPARAGRRRHPDPPQGQYRHRRWPAHHRRVARARRRLCARDAR